MALEIKEYSDAPVTCTTSEKMYTLKSKIKANTDKEHEHEQNNSDVQQNLS